MAGLYETLAHLRIPKVMGYQLADGATTVQFVRPAHGLVALHGTEVVDVGALGLRAAVVGVVLSMGPLVAALPGVPGSQTNGVRWLSRIR